MAFTDEEWEAVREEMPAPGHPVLLQYLKGREALIAQEKKQRSDYAFRQALSPIAKKACEIVARVREDERRRIWTSQLEEEVAVAAGAATGSDGTSRGVTLFPGQMFTHAKDLMEKTTLWKIVRRMPKGALLHAHCDAIVDYDYLFDVLLATPGIHINACDGPLDTPAHRAERRALFRFRAATRSLQQPGVLSPWDPAYVAGDQVLLADAADVFPATTAVPAGGRAAFKAWLISRCTLSPTDAAEQHHGLDHVWRLFHGCFVMLSNIIHYEPIWRAYLRRLMRQLNDDGVRWAEIRIMWGLDYCREGCEEPEPDYVHLFGVVKEELARFQAASSSSPSSAPAFWGLRFIWTGLRSLPTRSLAESMDHCIATKLAHPDLICGYDLVGQEDPGRTLREALPELFWFRQQCAAEGVEIPFFFHAGECLGDGDATDNNLFDAILLGTRRIGHGFSLYKHPLLIDLIKDKRILIESCPISNEVLRLCGSILSHPLPALLARGVACGLNNDDPAMLGQGTAGMTHDFWQALQGWENLGLAGLGSLAENSVRWAALEDQTSDEWVRDIKAASLGTGLKARRLKEWSMEWEQFCLWVVTEYADQYGDGHD